MRYLTVGALALLALAGCARPGAEAAAPAPASPADVTAQVRAELEKAVQKGAPGVTAIVMRDGKQLLRLDVGKIAPDQEFPIASASKWMTAALVMTVVDEGKLSLDAPISTVLPEFQGPAAKTTLRQLLSQTSGEGSLMSMVDIKQDARITLGESAAQVARRPLEDTPGTVFKYGGPGFQVAGAMVEKVTGRRWADLFDERITKPLGMKTLYWTHLPAHGATPAQTLNPLLQGGVVTTADDYVRFLTMLAQNGRYNGRQILSAKAVQEMETVQTLGKPMAWVPPGVKARGGATLQYALGNWCEAWQADGQCFRMSSPGAFGTLPWIDRKNNLYGIFFTKERLPKIEPYFAQARVEIATAYK
jgi:CubicO group peptidase (beta-lactamase class C family)